ncbi:MAG: phosphoribosylformylglycinamidine synthase, partial [Betaproteobacteria bacterium]
MSLTLELPGRRALSEFRLEKLLQQAQTALPGIVGIRTQYWHFAKLAREISRDEQAKLNALLSYGPAWADEHLNRDIVLVVPRLGTLSPWSSKATDIARQCGLDAVERIERGTAYRFEGIAFAKLRAASRQALLDSIHDRMTETTLSSLEQADALFHAAVPQPLATIGVLLGGEGALLAADRRLGLALSKDEVAYLLEYFLRIGRDPTDVELMMFAQANSEHCRHKIFNADWVIDGVAQPQSLFSMIRHTHAEHPQGTLVAYSDNAAVMQGTRVERFFPAGDGSYRYKSQDTHILMKVETHNHPTAISPFSGAATGSGGEIRDEGATGRGSKPKAGLTGFSVSHLRVPGFLQPWEVDDPGKPDRISSALQIMLDGPIGGAAFNNEFGRPNLLGYFRTFEHKLAGEQRGYHKPIM